jgi:hypothetical protein
VFLCASSVRRGKNNVNRELLALATFKIFHLKKEKLFSRVIIGHIADLFRGERIQPFEASNYMGGYDRIFRHPSADLQTS